jgi:hypothetical protein
MTETRRGCIHFAASLLIALGSLHAAHAQADPKIDYPLPDYNSPDIWVVDQDGTTKVDPKRGAINRLVAQITNLGPSPAGSFTVKFAYAPFGVWGFSSDADFKEIEVTQPVPPPPYDHLFVFTRVGLIGVDQIDTVGATASGYAYPAISPAPPASSDANSPFGSTLDIAGWFGQQAQVYRYKVQVDDGSGWRDVTDPLANTYYDFALGGGSWRTVAMGRSTQEARSTSTRCPSWSGRANLGPSPT